MTEELATAGTLQDQWFGGVGFTVGGGEVLVGQWKFDVGLFDKKKRGKQYCITI